MKEELLGGRLAGATGGSLGDRLRRWRLRTIADSAFRSRIAAFAPLRFLARRKARDLFSTVSGFVRSQILFAALESGLLDLLSGGPLGKHEIASALGLDEAQASRLLASARGIGLVDEDRKGRWWLDDAGAVVTGDPGIAAMIRHHALLYRDLADPLKLLREPDAPTLTQDLWAYVRGGAAENPPPQAGNYSRLMTASQNMLIDEVLAAHDFGAHRAVMDIGGGEGGFLRALGRRHPGCRRMLFDLPAVTALGDATDGIERFGGDFFRDRLPEGADCVTLLRVVCDHEDESVLSLLANVRDSLPAGGVVLVGEPMDGPESDQRMVAAYFGFYFLAMRSGRCRSAQEIGSLLKRSGFGPVRLLRARNPLAASVIAAHKA